MADAQCCGDRAYVEIAPSLVLISEPPRGDFDSAHLSECSREAVCHAVGKILVH